MTPPDRQVARPADRHGSHSGAGRPSDPVAAVVLAGHDGHLPRLSLSVAEACGTLGIGHDFWLEHVAPEVRIVRVGRRKLVPVSELVAFLDRHAETPLAPGNHYAVRPTGPPAASDSRGARQSRASANRTEAA